MVAIGRVVATLHPMGRWERRSLPERAAHREQDNEEARMQSTSKTSNIAQVRTFYYLNELKVG